MSAFNNHFYIAPVTDVHQALDVFEADKTTVDAGTTNCIGTIESRYHRMFYQVSLKHQCLHICIDVFNVTTL